MASNKSCSPVISVENLMKDKDSHYKNIHMHIHVKFYIQFICIFRVTDSRLRAPVWGHKSLLNPDINHTRSTENKL